MYHPEGPFGIDVGLYNRLSFWCLSICSQFLRSFNEICFGFTQGRTLLKMIPIGPPFRQLPIKKLQFSNISRQIVFRYFKSIWKSFFGYGNVLKLSHLSVPTESSKLNHCMTRSNFQNNKKSIRIPNLDHISRSLGCHTDKAFKDSQEEWTAVVCRRGLKVTVLWWEDVRGSNLT